MKLMTKKTTTLLLSQGLSEGSILIRNIILARALGPDEMGAVVALAVTLKFIEMATDLSVERLLVQARDGGKPTMQGSAHGLHVARGVLAGILLAALSWFAASLFGVSEMAWAFASLGLVPLVRGFVHLDYVRKQRYLNFRSTAMIESLSSLASAAAAWPIVIMVGDYSAFVWVSLIQVGVLIIGSHWVARRSYRIVLNPDALGRFLKFGWPMLLNGLLMFGAFQGDRLIVATTYSMEELGRFAVLMQLALLPALITARISMSIGLPLLSRAREHKERFIQVYQSTQLILVVVAVIYFIALALMGNPAISFLYGHEFVIHGPVLNWVAMAMVFRMLRGAPTIAALAHGDSQAGMYANIFRFTGLIAAVAASGFGLTAIAAAGCMGEAIALFASYELLRRRHGINSFPSFPNYSDVLDKWNQRFSRTHVANSK